MYMLECLYLLISFQDDIQDVSMPLNTSRKDRPSPHFLHTQFGS